MSEHGYRSEYAYRLARTIATLAELAREPPSLDRCAALLDVVREQLEALAAWTMLELERGNLELAAVDQLGEVLERIAAIHAGLARQTETELRARSRIAGVVPAGDKSL